MPTGKSSGSSWTLPGRQPCRLNMRLHNPEQHLSMRPTRCSSCRMTRPSQIVLWSLGSSRAVSNRCDKQHAFGFHLQLLLDLHPVHEHNKDACCALCSMT